MDAKDYMSVSPPLIEKDMGLFAMLKMQKELLQDYIVIEKFRDYPWDMRLRANQIEAKGFIFRVIEELAEAYESLLNDDEINFWTELADATHFLLELGIVTGSEMQQGQWMDIWLDHDTQPKILLNKERIQRWFWDVTFHLGLVSNAMRNKQWKQTDMPIDMTKFHGLMFDVYDHFFKGFVNIGATEYGVYGWYWRKNQVNKFRIRSKY